MDKTQNFCDCVAKEDLLGFRGVAGYCVAERNVYTCLRNKNKNFTGNVHAYTSIYTNTYKKLYFVLALWRVLQPGVVW